MAELNSNQTTKKEYQINPLSPCIVRVGERKKDMRAQVIINDEFLKSQYRIYRYSIVDITYVHKRKKDGHIWYYRATYKGGKEITYRPHEIKILEEQK